MRLEPPEKNIPGQSSPNDIMTSTNKKQTGEKKIIFFRNDDVGLYSTEPVARELINLTNLFIEADIPICHAVVPAEVNKETVCWLRKVKSLHPDLISIGQHGFKHVKNDRGEFGGARSYKQQKEDILNGFELMKRYFGSDFSYWFAVPWISYNRHTKAICDELDFKVFSGGVSPRLYARIFNALARSFNLNVLGFKEVSYHRNNNFAQNGFNMREISVAVDVVQDYRLRLVKPSDCILNRFRQCERHFNVIGFMLHHWIFDTEQKLNVIRMLLPELKKNPNISLCPIDNI